MTLMNLFTLTLFGGIGLVLGLAHFYGLRRDTQKYLARGVGLLAVALHIARIVATTAVLVFIARNGAVPLLTALMGFLAARFVVVAHVRRTA
jgi:F1F0 ATPase subunit 2